MAVPINVETAMLTYEVIKEVLDYDSATGSLKWGSKAHHTVRGKEAGAANVAGYIDLRYKEKRMYAHRVAWLLTYKEWPKGHIDHINGITSDNRIANLRVVNNQQNHKNMKRHQGNKSGVTGVYWSNKAKKWQAYICVNYKQIYLGVFKYLVDAETARKDAEIRYGFHKNHGRKTEANVSLR